MRVLAGAMLLALCAPAARGEEWVGSESCAACHARLHERWSRSTHALSVRDFSPATVAKPFDGSVFTARDLDHRLGPGASLSCEGPGGIARSFEVEWVVGVRRIQMYTTRLEGGRIQVLPVFLEVPAGKWFDYADFIFGGPAELIIPPDSPNSWYTHARNFNSRCGACHMTDFATGYDPDTGRYASTWSEPAVGCEACHGPGGAHVTKWRRLEDGPDPIVNAGRLGVVRSNQACGFCHVEGDVVDPRFRPGDDLFAAVDVFGLEDGKHTHVDGRARELLHNFVPLLESRCGPLACTACHDPHGSGRPGDLAQALDDDTLCTQCHRELATDLVRHTRHTAAGAGSRCLACHMPRLVIEAGHGRVYDHTISIPSPRNTARHGLPNACRSCHLTEEPGWDALHFERLWPGAEERNHRVRLADTVTAARARRPDALDPLRVLAADGNPVYRAGAAWLLSGYDADVTPLLADPHPLVRRAAVKGAARQHPEALERLLADASPVLRRAAALALAEKRIARPFDWIEARPELRERALGVLVDCAALRPDEARLHFAVAALCELAGRKAEALRSYDRYLRLRPWDERARQHRAALAVR